MYLSNQCFRWNVVFAFADALAYWEYHPGEGESRLRGDGTEGAKAIEDQRKAKAAREAEKESRPERE